MQYSEWIANIVSVKKKNEQFRICVDFCVLNKACPKDAFSLCILDLLDNVDGCQIFFFMDGFSGYNQIYMAPKDEEKKECYAPMSILLHRCSDWFEECMSYVSTSHSEYLHRHVA